MNSWAFGISKGAVAAPDQLTIERGKGNMVTKFGENRSRARLSLGLFVLTTILVWIATGCQPPTPTSTPTPTPTPTPIPTSTPTSIAAVQPPVISEPKVGASTPLKPGEKVGIAVDVVSCPPGVTLTYDWKVEEDGGEIIKGQESPAITYHAPNVPGLYSVRVVVHWDGQSVEKTTFITVEEEPTPEPTEEPTPEPTEEPTPTVTTMPDAVVVDHVNLRSGPGTEYDIIGTLIPGQVLTITGRITDATWLQVNTDRTQDGWVANQAELVTVNLPTEEIPIVSTPPPPSPKSPMPTQMPFQNFEPDNGTPAPYFEDVWKMNCEFEYKEVYQGSWSLKCRAHWGEENCPDCHGGTVRIYPSSDPIDLSPFTTIFVWVYDTQDNNTVELRLCDDSARSNNVWSDISPGPGERASQEQWTRITWPLSAFTDVDKSRIRSIEIYEWNDGLYCFDAIGYE